MKPEEKDQARTLRSEDGLAMKEIARRLGVSVSSVSLWTRDIPLSEDQIAALKTRNHRYRGQQRGKTARADSAREARRTSQLHGRELAREGDPLHRAGCMLFWAEGSKCRNAVKLTNSDVAMLRYFVRFLEGCYGVEPERISFTVNCHLNNGLDIEQIHQWWLDQLNLPRSSLRSPSIGRPSSASRFRRNTLIYGTGRVTVYSTHIVQSIYGAIQEYVGIERAEWLDCAPKPDDS